MRKLIGILLLLMVMIVLSPWAIGLYFQRIYQHEIALINYKGDVVIQIVQYKRGWLTSKSVLRAHIKNSSVLDLWKQLGVEDPNLDITIAQTIHHGPWLSFHPNSSLKFGLASILNNVSVSPDIESVLRKYDAAAKLVTECNGAVNFRGNYYGQLKLSPFAVIYRPQNLDFEFKQGLQINAWLMPHKPRLIGDLKISAFMLENGFERLQIPGMQIYLDQYKSYSGLWIGRFGINISQAFLYGTKDYNVQLMGLNLAGETRESSGKLYGTRSLGIQQIVVNDQKAGPLLIKMSASGLSAKAIINLLAVYQRIKQEGELYESQLEQKLSMTFPSIFTKQSEIKLETLEFAAPEGNFHAKGKIFWPLNETSASGVMQLMQDAYAHIDMSVSKALVNRIIGYISELPYFRSITTERRKQLLDMDSNIQAASQRNLLFLSMLVREGIMPEDAALQLLEMQRNEATVAEYATALKTMYLEKEISRPLTYLLFWQYADVEQQANILMSALDADEAIVKKQFHDQVNDWLKKGYITQDNKDYFVKMKKDSGEVTLNGKQVLDQSKLTKASAR